MENKYSGMLAWEEGILYLCDISKILSLVAKKYSSKFDIISLVYSYLCAYKCKWKQLEYSNLYFYA